MSIRGHAITLEDLISGGADVRRLREQGITEQEISSARRGSRRQGAPRNAGAIAGRCQVRDVETGENKTELAFRREILIPLLDEGVLIRVDYEVEGLRVGPPGTAGVYWPDYRVIWAEGLIDFVEVKGYWLDDARVKIKAAASMHPYAFHAAMRRKKADGGGWTIETIGRRPGWEERTATARQQKGRPQ